MYKTKVLRSKGFTLIEMLIVVGMAGILAAGVGTMIGQGPRQSARDSRRQADLESIRSSLELYRNDLGYYPSAGNYACSGSSPCLATTYITSLPRDPQNSTAYNYVPTGSCGGGACRYSLQAHLEKLGPGWNYTITSP